MARKERLLRGLPVNRVVSVQMRSVAKDGKKSAWSPVFQFRTTADTVPPSPPSNLEFSDFGTSFAAMWDAPTTNADGTNLVDLGGYKVTVHNGSESVSYNVPSERFDFTHEMNVAAFGRAVPFIRLTVQAKDVNGNISEPLEMEADNTPPETPRGVVLEAGLETIYVTWEHNTEEDLDGYNVYVGETASFALDESTRIYQGFGNLVSFSAEQGRDYYVRVTAYDRFGNESGPSDSVSVIGEGLDVIPPAVPTGLNLAVNSYISGQVLLGRIVAKWNANTDEDLQGYYIRIHKLDSADYSTYFQDKILPTYEFTGMLPNTLYGVQVAAVDKSNNVSAYCTEVTISTLGDTTAPPRPLMYKPRVDAGLIEFDWNDNTASDFKDYVFQIAEDAGFTVGVQQFYLNASRYAFVGNPLKTYWGRVAARDQSLNVSPWGYRADGTYPNTSPGQVPSDYIANLEVDKLVSGKITSAEIELTQGAKIFSTGAWSLDANEFYMAKGNITLGISGFHALNSGEFYSGGTSWETAKWRTSAGGHMRVGGAGKFHVDESGAIWSGHEDKTLAPWGIDGAGFGFFDSVKLTGKLIPVGEDLVNAADKFVVRKTSTAYRVYLAGNMDIESGGNLRLAGGSISLTTGNMNLNGGTLSLQSGSVLFNGAPVTINNSVLTLTETGRLIAGSPTVSYGSSSSTVGGTGLILDRFGLVLTKGGVKQIELLSTGNAYFRGTVDGAVIKGSIISGTVFTTATNATTGTPEGTGPRTVISTNGDITFWHYDSVTGQLRSSTLRHGLNDGIEIDGSLRVGRVGALRTLYAASVKAAQLQFDLGNNNFVNAARADHDHGTDYANRSHDHSSFSNHLRLSGPYRFEINNGSYEVAWNAWGGSGTPDVGPTSPSNMNEMMCTNFSGNTRGVGGLYFRATSSETIKENLEDAPSMLDRFKQVQVKRYHFKEAVEEVKSSKLTATKKRAAIEELPKQTGFIVEQVREVMPELTLGDGILINDTVAALWKISQEQQALIEDLQAQLQELKNQN